MLAAWAITKIVKLFCHWWHLLVVLFSVIWYYLNLCFQRPGTAPGSGGKCQTTSLQKGCVREWHCLEFTVQNCRKEDLESSLKTRQLKWIGFWQAWRRSTPWSKPGGFSCFSTSLWRPVASAAYPAVPVLLTVRMLLRLVPNINHRWHSM